jgi:hypothetical protein
MLGVSGQGAGGGVVQHDGDDRGLQRRRALDGQIDGRRGLGFDPVADAAQRAVGFKRRADGGDQGVEAAGPTGACLDDDLQLGPVLVVVAQRRQGHLRFARLAIAQDDQTGSWDSFGQDLIAQGKGGKRLQPRVQRGDDGFAGGGQVSFQERVKHRRQIREEWLKVTLCQQCRSATEAF